MDQYPVTKALWDTVYQWATNHGYTFDNLGSSDPWENYSKGPNHPVHLINWDDCVKWYNARSEMEGRTPAYYTDASQTSVYRSGRYIVQNDWVKWSIGYRLPTEAEWERAARGRASGQRFPWGDTISWGQANYESYWSGVRHITLTISTRPRAIIRPSITTVIPIRARWAILRRTGMGCMTWQGTCGSGAGTSLARIRALCSPILVAQRRAGVACIGAAVGTRTRVAAGLHTALATTRHTSGTT